MQPRKAASRKDETPAGYKKLLPDVSFRHAIHPHSFYMTEGACQYPKRLLAYRQQFPAVVHRHQ
jgi:hypothetical protein